MFNEMYINNVISALSKNNYAPLMPPNQDLPAVQYLEGNTYQDELPAQQQNVPRSSAYNFFDNAHIDLPLASLAQVGESIYDATPMPSGEVASYSLFNQIAMQMVETGFLEANQSINNNPLFQYAPLDFDIDAQSPVLLEQAANNLQGGQSQLSNYAKLFGAHEYDVPKWQASAVGINPGLPLVDPELLNQPANHVVQQPLQEAAQTIDCDSIQQCIELNFFWKTKFNSIKRNFIKEANNLKKNKNAKEEEFGAYIEKSALVLKEKGASKSLINNFIKEIEIILYGKTRPNKYDSTKYDRIKEDIIQRAILLVNKKNVLEQELEKFLSEEIAEFEKKGASRATVSGFLIYLSQILFDTREIEKDILIEIREEIIKNAINVKNSMNFTRKNCKYYIDTSLSFLGKRGASQIAIDNLLKDLNAILYGEKPPRKNDNKKFSTLTREAIKGARALKFSASASAKKEYVSQVISNFQYAGASSSTVSRMKKKISEIFES